MCTIPSRSTLAAIALLAMAVGPALGHADEAFATKVKASDLDLKTDQGAAMLRTRIVHAALKACGSPEGRSLDDWARVWDCREAAIAQAIPHANALVAAAQQSTSYVASLPGTAAKPAQ